MHEKKKNQGLSESDSRDDSEMYPAQHEWWCWKSFTVQTGLNHGNQFEEGLIKQTC